MAQFSSSAGTYQNACNLMDRLKEAGIRSNITAGGISIHCEPDQVNQARSICKEFKASFDAGYTAHQEDIMLRSPSGYEELKRAKNDAIAVIKEWK
jgi:hypothetical protein